ncbi:glycosyltransferase [Massilia sp. SR12]
MAQKKILIGCSHFWPSIGGLETRMLQFGSGLVAAGYDVTVLTMAYPGRDSDVQRGVKIASVPIGELPQAIRAAVASGEYAACILVQDPLGTIVWSVEGLQVPPQTRLLIQPIINEDGYGRWKDNLDFRRRLAGIFRNATAALTMTRSGPDDRFMREAGLAHTYLPNANARVEAAGDFRSQFQIAPERFMILHVANLYPVKNHIGLIDALPDLPADWQVVMIGTPSGTPEYVEQVKAKLASRPEILYIPGLRADWVAAAMAAADVVVLASHGEGSPITLLEAMSHSKPWLATPTCGAANDHLGGFICPLSGFMPRLRRLAAQPELRRTLGQISHEHWEQCYAWPVVLQGWIDLIEHGQLQRSFGPAPALVQRMAAAADSLHATLVTEPMKISFLPAGGPNTASSRIRVFTMIASLKALGVEAVPYYDPSAHYFVFQKRLDYELVNLALHLKARGKVVVYDIDDLGPALDYWAPDPYIRRVLQEAALVTADTEGHADHVRQHYTVPAPIEVVPDTIDYYPTGWQAPEQLPQQPIRLLWFGSVSNIAMFERYAAALKDIEGVQLVVAINPPSIPQYAQQYPYIEFQPWTLEGFPAILRSCHLTVLMHDGADIDRSKSNNKMICSINMGVPAIVSDTPEYAATARLCGAEYSIFQGEQDLARCIAALATPAQRAHYLARAQPTIWQHFSPEVIARRFVAVLQQHFPLPRITLLLPQRGDAREAAARALAASLADDFVFTTVYRNESGGLPAGDLVVNFGAAEVVGAARVLQHDDPALRAPAIDFSTYHINSYRSGAVRFGWVGDVPNRRDEVHGLLIPAMQSDFQVSLLGEQVSAADAAVFFNTVDVLMLTSDKGAALATATAAMACGVFVIAPRHSELAELVRDRESGLLVDATAPAFREALQWCAANGDEVRRCGYRQAQALAMQAAGTILPSTWRRQLLRALA